MLRYGAALIVFVGLSGPAIAQAQCPELTRLRAHAAEASKETHGFPAQGRCDAYIRLSIAWNDVAKYAGDNREACAISMSTMNDIEKQHREVVQARDNVCTGRRARPFPAEVIQH